MARFTEYFRRKVFRMLEFWNNRHHKARKKHVCDMCGLEILPGQTYQRYSGKYDGEMFDCKYCLDCEKVIDAYCSQVDNEYSDDEIHEWLQEEFCSECIHGWHREDALDDCTFSEFHCPFILEKLPDR